MKNFERYKNYTTEDIAKLAAECKRLCDIVDETLKLLDRSLFVNYKDELKIKELKKKAEVKSGSLEGGIE